MIPRRYIEEWKENAPWPTDTQVEQDLVIERALIEIFSNDFLRENLAFRGGTALHKLFLKPQSRYSEDIDLVQTKGGAIKPVLNIVGKCLKFLGTKRKVKQSVINNTVIYRFDSEVPPVINLRLKIEINCREHFTVLGFKEIPYSIKNSWFSGSCILKSYELDELLGTKLRALYQRRKSRDLFDLYWSLMNGKVNINKVIESYIRYIDFVVNEPPTYKQFLLNMKKKIEDPEFLGDIYALLRPGIIYDGEKAFEIIKTKILEKL